MLEKIKTYVDELLLILMMKKEIPICFAKIELFFNFETKSSLRPFLSPLIFPKLWKQNFMHFGHKHVET